MKIINLKNGMLLSLLLVTGCTNLSNNSFLKGVNDIIGYNNNAEVREILPDSSNIIEEKSVLTDENVSKYLNNIKNDIRESNKRVDDSIKSNYKVFLGEVLVLKLDGETNAKLTNSPKNSTSKLSILDGNLIFRSIYKGTYGISLYKGATLNRKIEIKAIGKYNFPESDIYDIITRNSEKKNKTLEDAITLYKLYYPNGSKYEEVNYELLKYGEANNNSTLMKEGLNAIKGSLNKFNDKQKIDILNVANKLNENLYIPSSVYSTSDKNLINSLALYLKNKQNLDKRDIDFLEKNSQDKLINIDTSTIDKVKRWYDNTGNSSQVENVFSETNLEKAKDSLLDIGKNSIDTDPNLAISNLKKALTKENSKMKRAEIYYNIANAYLKLENKVEAMKYLRLINQQFPGTEWFNKSKELIKSL